MPKLLVVYVWPYFLPKFIFYIHPYLECVHVHVQLHMYACMCVGLYVYFFNSSLFISYRNNIFLNFFCPRLIFLKRSVFLSGLFYFNLLLNLAALFFTIKTYFFFCPFSCLFLFYSLSHKYPVNDHWVPCTVVGIRHIPEDAGQGSHLGKCWVQCLVCSQPHKVSTGEIR